MESKYKLTDDNGNDDIVYLDVFMKNNTTKKQPAVINISRSKSILASDCDQYLFSIVRMKIPIVTPLFLFPGYPLTITIENNGVRHSADLVFQSTTNDDEFKDGIYSYQIFAKMINDCINTIYDAFTPKPSVNPPMLIFDELTGLYSMYYPLEYIDNVHPYNANVPKLYFNNDLFLFFCNWVNIENTTDKTNRLLCISNGTNKTLYPLNTEYGAIRMTQEFKTPWAQNSLSTMAVTSTAIPVASVATSGGSLGETIRSGSLSYNIIEDFDLSALETGAPQCSELVYTPSCFRFSNLLSKSTLLDFDLTFYLYYGHIKEYRKLLIPPNFSFNIRVMFKKKRLNY
jgi:hypothetical protein